MKKFKYKDIFKAKSELLGKTVHFTSDCMIFPNFDVTGKVVDITLYEQRLLIHILKNGKRYRIDSNMYNLQFEVL